MYTLVMYTFFSDKIYKTLRGDFLQRPEAFGKAVFTTCILVTRILKIQTIWHSAQAVVNDEPLITVLIAKSKAV